ncbi:MAG: adenylate kinase family protein [Nanoarchaeota archaeon]|nr:adenylate kinase family protein [Nanoarchaeota archaeon]
MAKIIVVSGTPGTGKTSFSKMISDNFGYKYIDVNTIIRKYHLSEGYDKKRDCQIVDADRLMLFLRDEILRFKKLKNSKYTGLVIDSHLSHNLSPIYVDLCFITKCSLPTLKKRLSARGYSEEKIRENLDSEIFDICRVEAAENGHKVEIVETEFEKETRKHLSKIGLLH